MARFLFGGGGDGDIIKPTGLPYINAAANVYNSRSGGTQITDLQDVSGNAVATVTSDSSGQVLFYGPDNFIGTLWLDFGSGVRWALSPKAVDLAATQAVAVQRAADAAAPSYTPKARLPYSPADPLEQTLTTALDPLVIPRFASATARDIAFPSPVAGDRCFRTDLNADQVYAGGGWQTLSVSAWTQGMYTIVPTSGTFSIGSGNMGIRYRIDGKSVQFYLWASWASDTNYGNGTWTFVVPFNISANAVAVNHCYGNVFTAAGRFPVFGQYASGNQITPFTNTSSTSSAIAQFGASPTPGGGGWQASNFMRMSGFTELA